MSEPHTNLDRAAKSFDIRLIQRGVPERSLFVLTNSVNPARNFAQLYLDASVFEVRPRIATELPRTVQGFAAAMLSRVREIQARGPYRIVGVSEAGLVAYEAARLLLGVDEAIEFLGLIDCDCPAWQIRHARAASEDERASAKHPLARAALEYDAAASPLTLHLFSSVRGDERAMCRGWDAVLPLQQLRTVPVAAPSGECLDAATSRALACALSEVRERAVWSSAGADGDDTFALTIQRGGRGASPLFCLPGAGASVSDFVDLGAALGPRWHVQAFKARGSDGQRLPHASVEAAAAAYSCELVERQPSGDIHLLGHSFGGWIALEMAISLAARGRHVASLTLIDTEVPRGTPREFTRAEALARLGALYELAARRALGIALADLKARDPEAQLDYLHAALVRGGLLSGRSKPNDIRGAVTTFEAAIRTRYRPRATYEGVTNLVLVTPSSPPGVDALQKVDRAMREWRQLAPHASFLRGGGNHVTVLRSPNVQAIAHRLNQQTRVATAGVEQTVVRTQSGVTRDETWRVDDLRAAEGERV